VKIVFEREEKSCSITFKSKATGGIGSFSLLNVWYTNFSICWTGHSFYPSGVLILSSTYMSLNLLFLLVEDHLDYFLNAFVTSIPIWTETSFPVVKYFPNKSM
jgi:hypothetical protein